MRISGNQRGTSLIELMIVILILMIILTAVFEVISMAQQRTTTEQPKLDVIQQGREFMDQMSRDLHQAGYPSPRNFLGTGVLTASPVFNDSRTAVGIVKVSDGDLWFEGDVDGTGSVSVVRYHLDTSTTNGCPCLKRSQLPKISANPYSAQTTEVYQVEVQGVQNTNIFSAFAYGATGTPVSLPIDFTGNATTIATIDTIQSVITLRAPIQDPKTGIKPVTTLVVTAKLNNCSQAASGFAMSCQ
jgi:type II secretory pathway pseudopilin PulG